MPKPSRIPLRPVSSIAESLPAATPTVAATPSPAAPTTPIKGRGAKKKAKPKPSRRRFTAAQKLRVVREADACSERGEVEALLRREGIYSSLLAAWRRSLRLYGEKGLPTRGPGRPRTRDPQADQLAKLERENASLRRDIERLRAVVDVQKKLSSLLGMTLDEGAR